MDTIAHARAVFERQCTNRWAVARSPARDRIAKLNQLRAAIVRRRGDLAAAVHADFRKPPAETELSEIQLVLREISHTTRHLARWMRPQRAPTPLVLAGSRSEIRYQAKGVALILAPWNYPIDLVLTPLVAAVAAGNCAIVRPSEKVPQTAAALGALIAEVFEPDEVAVVGGDPSLAAALLELPFDHFFFTGSQRVGRLVMAAAAQHLASVTLELGGKSPAIVDETADIRGAAERIVWGKFVNGGQTCIAPDYALVHESVAPAFLDGARRALDLCYGRTEAAREESASYCRIIDSAAHQRLVALVDAAVRAGARVEAGGAFSPATRYLAPTILSNVSPDSPLMAREIFGPVLPVLTYRSPEEAYRLVRSGDPPLALYVFSRDSRRVEDLLARTAAGGTVVNNTLLHFANPHLPFGGVGASGLGNYHGWFGFRAFSNERAVLRGGRWNPLRLLYPPYGARTTRILRLVDRWLT